jgi:asparagine synthase (glutamine-hydrolysing)
MCGICGIIRYSGESDPDDSRLIEEMKQAMVYRGPDNQGTYQNHGVTLGHQRLSIIDLSEHGRQPMPNEDETLWIIYNGEIYNFRELKSQYRLEESGHRFRSRTDTEVLVHLYEELGTDMFCQLNGMFALAIWDSRKRELILARDRFGIKPLFYTHLPDRFLFASEIKCILKDPAYQPHLNPQAAYDYFTFDYVPGDQTIFDGIQEVPSWHYMKVSSTGSMELVRYDDIEYDIDTSLSESHILTEIDHLMEQAVQRQLVSDVPLGVLLSGGMDSSALVAYMKRVTDQTIKTFSIGFKEPSFNELPYAQMVAEHYQADNQHVIIDPEKVRDMLPKYLSYIDEPYADGSAIPTYYVSQLAKQQVTVVLSGEGGDEVFAGYDTHLAYLARRRFRHIPSVIRDGIIAPIINRLPVSHKKLSLEFRMKRFLGGVDLPPEHAHLWWRTVLTEAQKQKLFDEDFFRTHNPEPSVRWFETLFRKSRAEDDLNSLLYIDAGLFLPDDLMIKNDRMTMAHSLEARVPFTDNDLYRFLARVPVSLKLKHNIKKYLLRKVCNPILPKTVINKKKVGLEIPYSQWMTGPLKPLLDQYLNPESLKNTGIFQPDFVTTMIDQHQNLVADHGRFLWGILNFMMWKQLYMP